MPKKIIVEAPISKDFSDFLIAKNYKLVSAQAATESAQDVVGVITSNKLILDAQFLSSFTALKWVARIGSGMEIIDTAYCQQHQIFVCSSPAGIADAVAEHAIGMLISGLKNIHTSFASVQNHQWIREPNRGLELSALCVGIIGLGHTGTAFNKLLSAFGCKIIGFDTNADKKGYADTCKLVSLEQLYEQCDVVSYHVPLNASTAHYYDSKLFKKQHVLINTSRGEVCSTSAILEGLQNEKLLYACLDVLDMEKGIASKEPHAVAQLNTLLQWKNVLITPHIAGYSHNATLKMSEEVKSKLIAKNLL